MEAGIQEAENRGFQGIQRSGTALFPPYNTVLPPQWKIICPSLFLLDYLLPPTPSIHVSLPLENIFL